MAYNSIRPSGSDTGTPLNLQKRLALIQEYVQLPGKKIIDCGCGAGQYVVGLLASGVDAWGVEYEISKVSQFQKAYPELSERISVGDIEHLTFKDKSFDMALLNEVLEHIPEEMKALEEVKRVLKPGGTVIIFSPNRLYPFETHPTWLKNSTFKLPIYLRLTPYIPLGLGNRLFDYSARNYWPAELRRLVEQAGFQIAHTDYMWQTFENISGNQPGIVAPLRPMLRKLFSVLERTPVIRASGVSQVIVANR
jgi:ubiquinone/menaquinone biosynthesis C-methylase UbiE